MATPLRLDEVAKLIGLSKRTMYRLIRELDLTVHKMPGGGKAIYLDPDEVRRKRKPKPRPSGEPSPKPPEVPAPPPSRRARTADGRPVMVAAIVPHPDGRPEVLMTGRVWAEEPVWSWCGGHVRDGEDPAAAVLRELAEELAVRDPCVVRLLGEVDTHLDASRWWGDRFTRGYLSYNFQIAVASPEVAVIDHEELRGVEWRTLDQVAEALATLPAELREPALRFAREAIATVPAAE